MAEIPVYSRAHRSFRRQRRFHFARSEPELVQRYRALAEGLEFGEIIGVYLNPDQIRPEAIIADDLGLVVLDHGVATRLLFSEMKSATIAEVLDECYDIAISLRSGSPFNLKIAGRNGRFRDLFNFLHFLIRVLEDMKPGAR